MGKIGNILEIRNFINFDDFTRKYTNEALKTKIENKILNEYLSPQEESILYMAFLFRK